MPLTAASRPTMSTDRRRFLTLGTLAGCSSQAPTNDAEDAAATSTEVQTGTPTPTPTPTSDQPPGADVLGGPGRLQGSATVDAATLADDQGAGQFVFTPAVVWVEPGATVEWTVSGGAHSITAYHPNDDRSMQLPESAAPFDSGVLEAGDTFEHTFEAAGVHNYYCTPHEGLGMVGLVVVGEPRGDRGRPTLRTSRRARPPRLSGRSSPSWGWRAVTDSRRTAGRRRPGTRTGTRCTTCRRTSPCRATAYSSRTTTGSNRRSTSACRRYCRTPTSTNPPSRTRTSTWPPSPGATRTSRSSPCSTSSLAWTHLKGVTWAKNFETHFEILPESLAAKFRAQMLTTLAQLGIVAGLVGGGPEENGALTKGESLELVSAFRPADGSYPDRTARPTHHAAMLWFLSDMTSLAQNGWFGYVNPEPLVPAEKIQQLTDGVAKTTMNLFDPSDVVGAGSVRDLGLLLGAMGWYGTHAGSDEMVAGAADYANALASAVESNPDGNGRVENGAANQAATQGVVGQGLLRASQVDGVDYASTAESVLGYLAEELFDADAGTFASGEDASTYRITARDAGDITGGVNAADELLGMDLKDQYARFFDQTFNRGRL